MRFTRRVFFKEMIGRVTDFLKVEGITQKKQSFTSWITVGKLKDFPPGKILLVNAGRHILHSSSEGLEVYDKNHCQESGETVEQTRPLRIDQNGTISMNPYGSWPRGSKLSDMTGERIPQEEENKL